MWLVAFGYVAAACLAAGALSLGQDPRVAARLVPRETGGARPSATHASMATRRRPEWRRTGRGSEPPSDQGAEPAGRARVLAAAAGLVVGSAAWPSAATIPLAATLAAGGYVLPGFVAGRRARAARARAAAAVPDLLDAIALCVTAGLTPRLALDRATGASGGVIRAELERARREISLGASWRGALREVASRTGLDELRRLCVTLERSERLGSPVAEQIRRLARDVRDDRRLREEERARRAPIAMLFPLVFCILPAFVLAAVVPAILVAARGVT